MFVTLLAPWTDALVDQIGRHVSVSTDFGVEWSAQCDSSCVELYGPQDSTLRNLTFT